MWSFSWQNLLTRPSRTILAIVGLSIPILGVIGLFSLSGGIRNLMGDTLSQVHGLLVLRENVPSPIFSDLPAKLADTIRKIPDVRVVAPEVGRSPPRSRAAGCSHERPRACLHDRTSSGSRGC